MASTLYVGNLPFSATEDGLKNLFETNGRSVKKVRLINDRDTGSPRGFGFVEMDSDEEAQEALEELKDAAMDGRNLTITLARER